MDNVQALTGANLSAFLLVLVALLGIFVLFTQAVDGVRKLMKPRAKQDSDQAEKMRSCDRKFQNDQRALEDHETRVSELERGNQVVCYALHALLEHELHNGNSAEMKSASDQLFNYLNGGK